MANKKYSTSSLVIGLLAYVPGFCLLLLPVTGRAEATSTISFFACYFIYLGSLAIYDPAKKSGEAIMKLTFALFFAIYIITIISFTLFDGAFGRHATKPFPVDFDALKVHFDAYSNLVPFYTLKNIIKGFRAGNVSPRFFITNICGNLAAFAPFAFFMPILFKRMRRFFPFLIFISVAVVLIECLQIILMTGSADIDDFILNVAGACVLYAVLHVKPMKRLIFNITKLHI